MWPWGHLAVGYLCYVAAIKLRSEGEQTLFTLVAVAVGTQFPDLIDKPLAWSTTILPSGRSFAHSLITATLIIGIVYWIGQRLDSEEGALAFGIGYLSHSIFDLGPRVVFGFLTGDLSQLKWTTYLLWPLLPSPPYPHDSSFHEHFIALTLDPYMITQLVLLGVAVAVWIITGMPGVTEIQQRVKNHLHRERETDH
ncbi:metal-dependent hydrolase [Haladaptatus halobius]|uniref:metal-dependent hydrolase n=1 Tax=Haladaptatus halobius TaxID=2884875 RepID=UPI001D0AD00E|nr:metal-dependent hydrolase [Haladaptatus halobius]